MRNIDDQLNRYYAENGQQFTSREAAVRLLRKKGYYECRGEYRNPAGKKAFLTKIRDAFYTQRGKEMIQIGWLVTFSGNTPIPAEQLKISPLNSDS